MSLEKFSGVPGGSRLQANALQSEDSTVTLLRCQGITITRATPHGTRTHSAPHRGGADEDPAPPAEGTCKPLAVPRHIWS